MEGAGSEFEDDGETALIRKAAVDTVAHTEKPVIVPQSAAPLSPDELLGAVAYCYVKGVFSSDDVERKMLRDPEFREALDGVVPDPATIRRFRRLNREAIQTVLEKFYAILRQRQKNVREASLACGPDGKSCPPVEGGNTAVFVKREAIDQLDRATFVDRMSDF